MNAVRAHQEPVQVPAGDPEHPPVKHRIDVIRPAFEALDRDPARAERLKQPAGQNGLSGAALHRRDEDPLHTRLPEIKKTGLFDMRRCSPPTPFARLTAICAISVSNPFAPIHSAAS